MTGPLNRIQYSDVGTHLAPLQILDRLEQLYNVIIEIQFSDGCMVKTLLRRKKQARRLSVSSALTVNIFIVPRCRFKDNR